MKTNLTKHLVTAAAFAFSGSVCAQESGQPVAVKVDGLPRHVAERVQEKARQGPAALRQYVQRTRMIHELHYGSLIRSEVPAALAKAERPEHIAGSRTASTSR
jgi:hypothetical protein